ncbi:protein neprosin-like [Nicotiana sylvestris]|uniref:protein neprosin-like n=1 Tax=Nicotiana sylvestris TaxID=4096 RepID=UPI00388CBBA9
MPIRQQIVRQTLLVLFFLLSYDGVQGEIKLSELEDLELEKQLKLLNKPATKTIKTKYGDTYDCVDFYKQSAFDHPLLKNHNFHPQMKPTLTRTLHNSDISAANKLSSIWLKKKGCPFGTVPIRRVTKNDLIRHKHIPPPENIIEAQLTNRAIAQIPNNPNNKFAGAGMTANIYNPHVEGQQHSAVRLKIFKGYDVLQVGWRVDPTLYNDTNTRLYIHTQVGNMHCFNTLCSGFVLVNTELPVDMVFDEISHRGAKVVVEITMFIQRDPANGLWWLLIGENYDEVGFWPQRIFTDLASLATHVEFGGVVYIPPGGPKPPMGSSCFPIADPLYDAYCRRLHVLIDNNNETVPVDTTIAQAEDPNLYEVRDVPHWGHGKFQHFIFYGGRGDIDTWC